MKGLLKRAGAVACALVMTVASLQFTGEVHAAADLSIEIVGYQISASYEGIRTIYAEVDEAGIVGSRGLL